MKELFRALFPPLRLKAKSQSANKTRSGKKRAEKPLLLFPEAHRYLLRPPKTLAVVIGLAFITLPPKKEDGGENQGKGSHDLGRRFVRTERSGSLKRSLDALTDVTGAHVLVGPAVVAVRVRSLSKKIVVFGLLYFNFNFFLNAHFGRVVGSSVMDG